MWVCAGCRGTGQGQGHEPRWYQQKKSPREGARGGGRSWWQQRRAGAAQMGVPAAGAGGGGTEHHLGTRRTPQSHTLAISTQHKVAGNGSLLVTGQGPAAPPRCPQDHGCRDRDSAPRSHPGAHLDAAWRGLTGLPVLGNFQVVFVRGDKAVPVPRARPRPLQEEKGARAEAPRGGWKCSRASDPLENHCTPGERKRNGALKCSQVL